MIYSTASARRCSASMDRGEDAPSRGLIGGSEGRNLDVKTPRDIERTCPPVYGSTYDTCRYSTPSVFSNRNPLPPIYCESRPISPLPPVYPIARPGNANLFFSARLGFIWCVSPLSFRTLPPLRGRPLFPPIVPSSLSSPAPCRSFAATILSYVVALSRSLPVSFLSAFRSLSFPPPSLTVAHPLRLPHFHRAHPRPAVFHSATPPTPPPSRPIQSPPRHPSFTASAAAYRLSFCHCGLFDILSTAVRTEARLSRGRREILETNDGGRKKSRTWEPILAPASRRF